jgi:hypothetical protein
MHVSSDHLRGHTHPDANQFCAAGLVATETRNDATRPDELQAIEEP